GANGTIPLTPPTGVAAGLQFGGGIKLRTGHPEWRATIGAFSRGFETFGQQHGNVALLLDYQRTTFQNDVFALRPIVGTTINSRDELGVEGRVGLNVDRLERANDSIITFWKRGWSDRLGTEFGAGYEFRRVNAALFRARASWGLTSRMALWCGGDADVNGSY